MTSDSHISKISAERFERAVKAALAEAQKASAPFTLLDVILSAKYDDGASVGRTTLYAKGADGAYVHRKLLAKLKAASAKSKSLRHPKVCLDEKVAFQQVERLPGMRALERQIVEQEVQVRALQSESRSRQLFVAHREDELYVALLVLDQLTKSSVLEIAKRLRELEAEIESRAVASTLRSRAADLSKQCRALLRDI